MSDAKPAPPTSAEIDRRLRIVSELRNLCLSLGQARKLPPPSPPPGPAGSADESHDTQIPG